MKNVNQYDTGVKAGFELIKKNISSDSKELLRNN